MKLRALDVLDHRLHAGRLSVTVENGQLTIDLAQKIHDSRNNTPPVCPTRESMAGNTSQSPVYRVPLPARSPVYPTLERSAGTRAAGAVTRYRGESLLSRWWITRYATAVADSWITLYATFGGIWTFSAVIRLPPPGGAGWKACATRRGQSVYPNNATHISSVLASPQRTSFGGELGFWVFPSELS